MFMPTVYVRLFPMPQILLVLLSRCLASKLPQNDLRTGASFAYSDWKQLGKQDLSHGNVAQYHLFCVLWHLDVGGLIWIVSYLGLQQNGVFEALSIECCKGTSLKLWVHDATCCSFCSSLFIYLLVANHLFLAMSWPSSVVVVRRWSITKWAALITQEQFDLESPNSTLTPTPTSIKPH